MTNADKIRQMTDEEMAEWLEYISNALRHGVVYLQPWIEWLKEEEEKNQNMRDMLLQITGFCVHVELDNTGSFTDVDANKMIDRIQKAIEQDPRCEMLITKKGEGGLMHRILYQKRIEE